MTRTFWWLRQCIMIVLGVFLLLFGVQLLIAAYRLTNPHWFIMTFFASNLIILISGALLAGFIAQIVKMHREGSGTLKATPAGEGDLTDEV